MKQSRIRKAEKQDIGALTEMGLLLFEESRYEELKAEFLKGMEEPDTVFFLLETEGVVAGVA